MHCKLRSESCAKVSHAALTAVEDAPSLDESQQEPRAHGESKEKVSVSASLRCFLDVFRASTLRLGSHVLLFARGKRIRGRRHLGATCEPRRRRRST